MSSSAGKTAQLTLADSAGLDLRHVLNALAGAVIVVDRHDVVQYVNSAAEELLQLSAAYLVGMKLNDLVAPNHPLPDMVRRVRSKGYSLTEYEVVLDSPRFPAQTVNVQASPLGDPSGEGAAPAGTVVIAITQLSIAHRIDQQLTHRNAARSVSGMAAILAHEVKNPLAGIRAAAQLLEDNASAGDRELTQLICDEADRICGLVDRMDVFSDPRPAPRRSVNIHEVLDHVLKVAKTSFARHLDLAQNYDPSLPPVLADRDQLVQIFMNLVKNAADAAPDDGGEIQVSTAFRHGVRLALRGGGESVAVPIAISIQDNGGGIPEDLKQHLFDPFVTTKPGGHGLGLALVAKIVGEHGGIIEFDSEPRRTVFRVMLPMSRDEEAR